MSTIKKVSVNGQVYDLGGSGGGSSMIEITYSELKSLVDSASLVPETKYRITDYVSTFKSWQSANHQFDIVVEALDEKTLSHEAKAMVHEGDSYFGESISAWKIWYTLDNTKYNFFDQVSSTGKGHIYRMIDEYGNDAPFDFKNAQFPLSNAEVKSINSSVGTLYFYMFSFYANLSAQDSIQDASVIGRAFNNQVEISSNFAPKRIILATKKYAMESFIPTMKSCISSNKIIYHTLSEDLYLITNDQFSRLSNNTFVEGFSADVIADRVVDSTISKVGFSNITSLSIVYSNLSYCYFEKDSSGGCSFTNVSITSDYDASIKLIGSGSDSNSLVRIRQGTSSGSVLELPSFSEKQVYAKYDHNTESWTTKIIDPFA